jgi:hypothetical protein
MFDDPNCVNPFLPVDPKQTNERIPPTPKGRSRRSSRFSHTDLGEFLDSEIYPALVERLDSAFPEYGFRRHAGHWEATQEATRRLPDAPLVRDGSVATTTGLGGL